MAKNTHKPDLRKLLVSMAADYEREIPRLPAECVFARSVLVGRLNQIIAEICRIDLENKGLQ